MPVLTYRATPRELGKYFECLVLFWVVLFGAFPRKSWNGSERRDVVSLSDF